MKPAEILRAARAKIEVPERWVQGRTSADADGDFVGVHEPEACRWCADGSVLRVLGEIKDKRPEQIHGQTAGFWLSQAARALGHETASKLNDTGTHADVLAMFDLAIRLAESSEGAAS